MASTENKKLALARQLLALKELNDELDEVRRSAQAGRELPSRRLVEALWKGAP